MDRVIMDWPTEFIVTEIAVFLPPVSDSLQGIGEQVSQDGAKVHVRHRESSRKAHIGSYIDRVFSGCLEIII